MLLHVADLALGSDLVQRSLLGPNPVLGSRFFGAGNELEIALAAVGLLGLGGALATASTRARVWGFAVGGGVLAFTMAWGRLGADVGAVPTVIAGATVAALVAAGNIAWRTRIAILLVAPVAGLAALALLDLVTGGDAHFSRSVLEAGGLDEIADIAERRVRLSYRSLGRGRDSVPGGVRPDRPGGGLPVPPRRSWPPRRARPGSGPPSTACWRQSWWAR